MKILLSLITVFPFFINSIFAESEVSAKFFANFDYQIAFKNQKKIDGINSNISQNQKNKGYLTYTNLGVDISNYISDNNIYGARISVSPLSSSLNNIALSESYIYTQGNFGRFEIGAGPTSFNILNLSANKISKNMSWHNYVSGLSNNKIMMNMHPQYFIAKPDKVSDSNFYTYLPRNISYISPPINNTLQLGITYIPSSESISSRDFNSNDIFSYSFNLPNNQKAHINHAAKNIFIPSIKISSKINENTDIAFSISSEFGKSTDLAKITDTNDNKISSHKLSNLKAYYLGILLNYGKYSYAASYGNHNKSFISDEIHGDNTESKFYQFTAAYNNGPLGASLSYFNGVRFNNKVSCTTFSSDYKLFDGFKAYYELSFYSILGHKSFIPSMLNSSKDRINVPGRLFLLGFKLSV